MKGGAIVTGASSGIGAATVRELAAAGYTVFGTVRRAKDTAAVQSAGATPLIMDVTYRPGIVRAQEAVARALGERPLVGLVNNAGIPAVGPMELIDLDDLRRTFEVNVFGAVAVTQAFLPMLRASRGRIVNISSVSARLALPFAGPYAASKFALDAISDSLRRELLAAGAGVDVIVIQPGSIRTAIWDKIAAVDRSRFQDTIYEKPLEKLQQLAAQSAARGMPPGRVARAVLRALADRRPPARLLVVAGDPLGRRLMCLIPTRWIDRAIARRLTR
ncbi:MAG: SDR family oxidoreductase [Gemmatimonadetes bacterium]|nr:SDR family oxidoreductase [Gemmatimonadota bacterium]